jgi:CBS domain containing-hemolysin-like protein
MSGTLLNLGLAVFLLAANGFYVASEFALVKSRGFRIDALAEEERFGARLLQTMLRNVEAYLACCQLGITMASLGLGWCRRRSRSASRCRSRNGSPIRSICPIWCSTR